MGCPDMSDTTRPTPHRKTAPSFGRAVPNSVSPKTLRVEEQLSGFPQPTLNILRVVAHGFKLMGRNSVTVLALVAAAAVPNRVVYHLMPPDSPLMIPLLTLITAVTCAFLYVGVLSCALRDLDGQPVSFGACLKSSFGMTAATAVFSLLTTLMVWLLLIVPGIGIATTLAAAGPVAVAEGKTVREAATRSASLIAPYQSQVRVLVLLLAALSLSRAFSMLWLWGLPLEAVLVFIVGNWLFPLLLTAFTASAGAALYSELRHIEPR